ncbi:hypothetical protein [Nonomuraea wenchangensis]|uniref:Uncharacterized protein n=1 Tax=Nonomuraea wenchangensis TaxID=568860 RepID=A0A1I0LTK9_9ACTN|nr:hypothetical protein [Nonomuraea wenchangensis]SEU46485.1 hypothetical protein SAMN05421811_12747 [Nonomuraea wenchangensis]
MTSNPRWKKRVREYAAAHGLSYQQAHEALTQAGTSAPAGDGWTADPAQWTHAGAGRWLVEFSEHGIGGDEVEPLHLDAASAADLKEQLGMLAMRRGWIDFWVELDGLTGRFRFDGLESGTDILAEFTLRLDPDEDVVELPRSFSHDMYELIDLVQQRFDCTVDAFTFVRGARGGDVEYMGLIYRAGTQMYHLLHITDREGGWEYTLSGGWPLARDEEAVEAFQAKVAEHIHA